MIEHQTSVSVPTEVAFDLFANRLGDWWPVENTFARVEGVLDRLVSIEIDSQPDGRWFERLSDGRVLAWGRVLHYERPSALKLTWQIGADGRPEPDADKASVVEVSFQGVNDRSTTVTVVHRDFDRHGPEAGEIWREAMASDEGWPKFLSAYQRYVEDAPSSGASETP